MGTPRRTEQLEPSSRIHAGNSAGKASDRHGLVVRSIRSDDVLRSAPYPLSLFDLARAGESAIDITVCGVGRRGFSLCRVSTAGGFQATTKESAGRDAVLIQMPTNGRLAYRDRTHRHDLPAGHGLITPFRERRDFHYPAGYEAINCTLGMKPLIGQMRALEGPAFAGSFDFEEQADLEAPALRSFRHNVVSVFERLGTCESESWLGGALVEEILISQLIGAWPRRPARAATAQPASSRHVQRSLDFIEVHLATPITVADVARIAGVGVRALQSSFRKDLGRTPVQYIIDRRLEQVHAELRGGGSDSISSIASRWGFIHMSDFARRYRQRFGCTPSETQIRSGRRG